MSLKVALFLKRCPEKFFFCQLTHMCTRVPICSYGYTVLAAANGVEEQNFSHLREKKLRVTDRKLSCRIVGSAAYRITEIHNFSRKPVKNKTQRNSNNTAKTSFPFSLPFPPHTNK